MKKGWGEAKKSYYEFLSEPVKVKTKKTPEEIEADVRAAGMRMPGEAPEKLPWE